ncbi:MAG TPA: DUF262 domain-containing protein [Dehalococcoidales bacterium]|nr:DUF262 domain-containing protein [Dehalococcoidales bacterium]
MKRNIYEDPEDDELEEDDEKIPLRIPKEFRNIKAEKFEISIRDLWKRYSSNNLVLEPDFQRHYVWDERRASRYIESLLLGLPTPPVFVAEETNGQWVVIDGHQRLASVFRFMKPLMQGPSMVAGVPVPWAQLTPLKLIDLEVVCEYSGHEVIVIPPEERELKVWGIKIPIVKLDRESQSNMKYVLFARLNLGSMSLNPQELRNCLYRGPYNNLVATLSEQGNYLSLWNKAGSDKRMKDRERVLRFFAFLHRMEKYEPPLRTFLNDEMETYQNFDSDTSDTFKNSYNETLKWVDRIFGKEAFKQYKRGYEENPSGHWVRNRYDLVYDVETVGFAQFLPQLTAFWNSSDARDKNLFRLILRNRLVHVMAREDFIASMLEGTMKLSAVRSRFNPWLDAMRSSISDINKTLDQAELLNDTISTNQMCIKCEIPVPIDEATLGSFDNKKGVIHLYCQRSPL